jgi:hypothetical protein
VPVIKVGLVQLMIQALWVHVVLNIPIKNLPIGIQTFSKLINKNNLYVDKTKDIYSLISKICLFLACFTLLICDRHQQKRGDRTSRHKKVTQAS